MYPNADESAESGEGFATATPAHRAACTAPLVFIAVGLDADRIHAPNERVSMALLLKGAEAAAYLWDELAAAAAELTAAR